MEETPVPRQIFDRRVDLVKNPGLARPGIAGEFAGAVPDDADPRQSAARGRREELPERPLAAVIAERDRLVARAGALDAMHRCAVLQHAQRAVFHQPDAVDPEEAPGGGQRLAGGQQLRKDQAGADPEREAPAALAEFDQHQRRHRRHDEDQPDRQIPQQEQREEATQQQGRVQQIAVPGALAGRDAGRADRAGRDQH